MIGCAIEVRRILGPGLLKSVEAILPIHQAQILSYLRLAKVLIGRLINFHFLKLANGIKPFVL
ncbi:MAG: GxxExxY protein [Chthoniobacterales bacterium]